MSTKSNEFPIFFLFFHWLEKIFTIFSRFPDQPILKKSDFLWTEDLEKNWQEIRNEFLKVYSVEKYVPAFQEVSPEQQSITQDDRWKVLILKAYGHSSARNTVLFPKTDEILRTIPGLKTAMFSIFRGPKEIPKHRGPYKGLLRVHLGLIIPESCGIEVKDQIYNWKEGEIFIFDDTQEHQAWNRSESERVVLFLDVLRPLHQPLDWINRLFIWAITASPYGKQCIARFEKWYEAKTEATGN